MTTNGADSPNQPSQTIVVGVDLAVSGLAALEYALSLGKQPNVTVHVVYALDKAADAEALPRVEALLQEGAARLREYLDRAQALEIFHRGVEAHVRLEGPVDAILQLAIDTEADLVVVGTERRRGLNDLLHSSVAMAIAQHASCPVVVARPKNYGDLSKTPKVLPLCQACKAERLRTGNVNAWCEQHAAERHFARHTYSYRRELSLRDTPAQREMPSH